MLTERQQLILGKVVEEYIANALPISSNFLSKEGGFDIAPATIRLDLAEQLAEITRVGQVTKERKVATAKAGQMKRIPKQDARRLLFVLEGFSENPF